LGDINTLASASTNAAARSRIVTLLAEEDQVQLALSRRRYAPEGRSLVNTATENLVEMTEKSSE
jgi:hypothetical protein